MFYIWNILFWYILTYEIWKNMRKINLCKKKNIHTQVSYTNTDITYISKKKMYIYIYIYTYFYIYIYIYTWNLKYIAILLIRN